MPRTEHFTETTVALIAREHLNHMIHDRLKTWKRVVLRDEALKYSPISVPCVTGDGLSKGDILSTLLAAILVASEFFLISLEMADTGNHCTRLLIHLIASLLNHIQILLKTLYK